jgi:hypothetical protein
MVFILKVWIRLLEVVVFYTNGSLESMRENFMDMNNPARYEPMHNKVISKVLEDTNQGNPSQGNYFSFPFFENVSAPLMATLNIHGLNVGLPVWLWTTLNVPNSLDASQIITLCQEHHMDVDPLSSAPVKPAPFSPSSGESIDSNS